MRRAELLALCFTGLMVGLFSSAMAGPVELVSNDGYLTFKGDLIELNDNMYVLKSTVGVVRIPVSDVSCKGEGCPGLSAKKVDKAPSRARAKLSGDWQTELFRDYRKNELFKDFLQWREKTEN